MDPVISVQNLGKKYSVPLHRHRGKVTLKETITERGKIWFQKLMKTSAPSGRTDQDFWALQNITFSVEQGDRIGIIGHNGSGKSTLLKILSRITDPTTGQARVRGRISSLLEIGTGFHRDLTGRENIFLGGAILGISHREMQKKFDEIVAFSEIEKFIDTPAKYYSSGMYVRLAFSVAVHLVAEILFIDEVLSVGDFAFQSKSLAKMNEISGNGRTILFVSHNLSAIEQLCNKAFWLEEGTLRSFHSNVTGVIHSYTDRASGGPASRRWKNTKDEYNNPWFQPFEFYIGDAAGQELTQPLRKDQPTWIYMTGRVREANHHLDIGYTLKTKKGALLCSCFSSNDPRNSFFRIPEGIQTLRATLPISLLNPDDYILEMIAHIDSREWLYEPGQGTPSIALTLSPALQDIKNGFLRQQGFLTPAVSWDIVTIPH